MPELRSEGWAGCLRRGGLRVDSLSGTQGGWAERSHAGDQTVHWICLCPHKGRLLGLNPLCMERGEYVCVCVCVCVGWGLLAEGVCGWCGRAGHPDTHAQARLSTCCSAASRPFVCSPCSQVFAIQHSSCLQSLPAYLQTVSSGVCNYHPSCSQPAPLDSCSHQPSCSQSPSQLLAATTHNSWLRIPL